MTTIGRVDHPSAYRIVDGQLVVDNPRLLVPLSSGLGIHAAKMYAEEGRLPQTVERGGVQNVVIVYVQSGIPVDDLPVGQLYEETVP